MAAEYTRGDMDVSEHRKTFGGVMQVSVTSSLLAAASVLFLTLAFATSTGWFASLVAAVIVGGLGGYVLKRGPVYYAILGVLTGLAAIAGFVIAAFAGA
jgi:hypothetical protein